MVLLLYFNPRSPRGLRRSMYSANSIFGDNFNPRSPRGLRPWRYCKWTGKTNFNPRSPRGLRPLFSTNVFSMAAHFNPRSPRGLRPKKAELKAARDAISIHAAQEGCDNCRLHCWRRILIISIHAAQEGCDKFCPDSLRCAKRFQSTQPKRAATYLLIVLPPYQSRFQSTQPKRAATVFKKVSVGVLPISIHAAQEGCDSKAEAPLHTVLTDFNPRSPRGLRQQSAQR